MSIKNRSRLVGLECIYPNQDQAAIKALQICKDGRSSALILAELQQGKTGVMISAAEQFIKDRVKDKLSFEVLVICNIPDNALKDQTETRFKSNGENEGAELNRMIGKLEREGKLAPKPSNDFDRLRVVHLRNLLNLPYQKVDIRLIISDEGHFALNKDGTLDTYLKSLGVIISMQPSHWNQKDKTKNFFCAVSATPFAHSVNDEDERQNQKDRSYEFIVLERTDNYYGLSDLLKDDRIKNMPDSVMVEHTRTAGFQPSYYWKHCILPTFLENNKKKYLIVRITNQGQKQEAFIRHLREQGLAFKVFTSDASKQRSNFSEFHPLKDLTTVLMEEPEENTIIIIAGAAKAGITLTPQAMNNIGGCVETPEYYNQGYDSVVQGLPGRCCGYGKGKYLFPIYCNKKAVEEVANYYLTAYKRYDSDGVDKTPRGNYNKATGKNSDALIDWEEISKEEASEWSKQDKRKQSVSSISQWDSRDVADELYSALNEHHMVRRLGKNKNIIHIDGPNPKYRESYNKLIRAYPQYKGKYLKPKETGKHRVDATVSLNKKSALRK